VFAGRSDFFFTSLLCGSAGVIGALVNVLPKVHGKLLKLHQEGNFKEAMALQAKLGHADWAMQKLGGISGVKAVVSKNFGYGVPNVRGPLKPLAIASLVGNKHVNTVEELIALEKSL
jgi:dihydrodipicolinate synthase/N-acetylneuraminate lyase